MDITIAPLRPGGKGVPGYERKFVPFRGVSVSHESPYESSTGLPPDFFDPTCLPSAPEELARFTSVREAQPVIESLRIAERSVIPRGVTFETRSLVFDRLPADHGPAVFDALASFGGLDLLDTSSHALPWELSVVPAVSATRELLDDRVWQPKPSPEYRKRLLNGINSPLISLINGVCSQSSPGPYTVLVVGSWSGSDIQRVCLARPDGPLLIDTYDHVAKPSWSSEFRAIMREKQKREVQGQHFSCPPDDLLASLKGRRYDLVVTSCSLHHYLKDGHLSTVVGAIMKSLRPGASVVGMIPDADGLASLDPSLSAQTGLLSRDPTGLGLTFGTIRVLIAGSEFVDPVLPTDKLIQEFAACGALCEALTASQVIDRAVVHKRLPYGMEARGFVFFYATKCDVLPLGLGSIAPLPFKSKLYDPPREPRRIPTATLIAHSTGMPVLDVDDFFLRTSTFYVAEKTDGVGGVLSVSSDEMVLRTGTVLEPSFFSWPISWDGPSFVLDGEVVGDPRSRWSFDAYALLRYKDGPGMSWLTGMTLARSLISQCHKRGILYHVGIKSWRQANLGNFRDAWNSSVEGVVLVHALAPPPRLISGRERGYVRYVKKVVTYDVEPTPRPGGGWDVVGLPHDYVGGIVEAELIDGVYSFVRARPDRVDANPFSVRRDKSQSLTYSDVIQMLEVRYSDAPVRVFLGEDPDWSEALRGNESEDFKRILVSTMVRPLLLFGKDGVLVDARPWYRRRLQLLRAMLTQ